MKYLLLILTMLTLISCNIPETKFSVKCWLPDGVKEWHSDEVKTAGTNSSGTEIWLRDGRSIEYPNAVVCEVTRT